MEHPATGRSASFIARDGTAETAEFRLWAFYPQSIAVLTFIYENGGEEAVRELTERLQADPRDDAALLGLRSEEHTSELQSRGHLVCRLLLEKKKKKKEKTTQKNK